VDALLLRYPRLAPSAHKRCANVTKKTQPGRTNRTGLLSPLGILMPAMARARGQAYTIVCRSNVRQLYLANMGYSLENNDYYVRAAEDTEVALIKDHFKGPSAVAISYDDPIAPAKVLAQFAKENDKLEIKVGVLNGKLLDVQAIEALATLPAREVLLAQFLSALNAVPISFVRAIAEIPRSLVNVLTAIKDQKEAA